MLAERAGILREPAFLAGGGECGKPIAGFDWSSSPVGLIEGWRQSLKAALGIVLHSPVPIVIRWCRRAAAGSASRR